jgi:squalene synthase HpnC
VLPAVHRRHLTALYGFARLTDDLGDEAREAGQADGDLRLRLLDELDADVDRIYQGTTPRSPVMQKMAVTVAECHVPAQPLRDLIQANRQDQRVTRYQTFAELAQYCELSANPVGQIVLYIFGVATGERIALSDSICTALQLAEHWQDVAEDLANGRIYLPGEAVQGGQVPPVHGREHAQRDGEVLPRGVGHHLFGARHPRADVFAHVGPVRSATAPGHLVIFQGMHI